MYCCEFCQKEISKNSVYCPYCGELVRLKPKENSYKGYVFDDDPEAEEYEESWLQANKAKIIVVLVAVAILFFVMRPPGKCDHCGQFAFRHRFTPTGYYMDVQTEYYCDDCFELAKLFES